MPPVPRVALSGVALYCRVSGDEQRERQTIKTQVEFGQRMADLQGVSLVDVFADDGVRGVVPFGERPEGARLLREARAGRVTQVWLYKLDRLGRAIRVILAAVDQLEEAGCTVRSLTEPFDTSTPAGRFQLTMMAGAAELERDNIADRTREGIERAARNGVWLSSERLYGYQIAGKGRHATLVVDEVEAEVVRLIFRLYVEQDLSCESVADYLNAAGIPTMYAAGSRIERTSGRPTSGRWSEGRIHNMLKTRAYCGTHEWGKESKAPGREIIRRPVPALVDVEIWERAQEVMDKRRTYALRSSRHSYLLRGLVWCGCCGRPYYGSTLGGYRYYRCQAKQPGRCTEPTTLCPSKSLPGSVEEEIWSDIEGFLRNPAPVVEELRGILAAQGETQFDRTKELQQIETAVAANAGERARVLTIYRKGWINDDDLESQLAAIEKEENALAVQREHTRRQVEAVTEARERLLQAGGLLQTLGTRLGEEISFEEKRHLVERLVERIDVETHGTGRAAKALVRVRYCFQAAPETGASCFSDNSLVARSGSP